eukprot:11123489-Prorocentrum_lima.AAC.1
MRSLKRAGAPRTKMTFIASCTFDCGGRESPDWIGATEAVRPRMCSMQRREDGLNFRMAPRPF